MVRGPPPPPVTMPVQGWAQAPGQPVQLKLAEKGLPLSAGLRRLVDGQPGGAAGTSVPSWGWPDRE